MDHFTPIASTLGGLLIGASAALLLAFHGRIAGISGIVGNAFSRETFTGDERTGHFRLWFLGGLLLGGLLLSVAYPAAFDLMPEGSLAPALAGGVLVGFGTRLGSGCTSGHGVCGMARLSPRSIAATGIFMVTAMVTVFVMRHVLGARS